LHACVASSGRSSVGAPWWLHARVCPGRCAESPSLEGRIMAILITCECGKRLHSRDEFAGRRARCPACGRVLILPSAPPRLAHGDNSRRADACPSRPNLPDHDPSANRRRSPEKDANKGDGIVSHGEAASESERPTGASRVSCKFCGSGEVDRSASPVAGLLILFVRCLLALGLFKLGLHVLPELRKFDPKTFLAVCFFCTYGCLRPQTGSRVKCRLCGKAQ